MLSCIICCVKVILIQALACVCMCISVHVFACMHACVCVCMCSCVCKCFICVCLCACAHVSYVCLNLCMCACICVCVPMCVCTCVGEVLLVSFGLINTGLGYVTASVLMCPMHHAPRHSCCLILPHTRIRVVHHSAWPHDVYQERPPLSPLC